MTVKHLGRKRTIRSHNGEGPRVDRVRRQHDNPVKLIKDLNSNLIDPFLLTRDQRKAVLVMTANGKRTSAELSLLLGCSVSTIRRMLSELRCEIGQEVSDWTVEEVLGSMVMVAEKCSAMAMDQGDPQVAWAIERDKVKILKELGVIKAGDPHEGVRVTIEALGQSYERATGILSKVLDPRLTGRVVDVEVIEGLPFRGAIAPASATPSSTPEVERVVPGEGH